MLVSETINTDLVEYYKILIEDYKYFKGDSYYNNDFQDYMAEHQLEDAIKIAVFSRDRHNKIDHHQRRIKLSSMQGFYNNLIKVINQIDNAKDFEELYNIFWTNRVSGIGDLTTYDICKRVGIYLKIFPDYIYIHAGAREGLKNLLKKSMKMEYIKKEELPDPFNSCSLMPVELEDFFCNYRKHLKVIYQP